MPGIMANIQHVAQSEAHAQMKRAVAVRTCDCVTAEEDTMGRGRHHQQSTDDDDKEFKQVVQR